MKRLMLGHAVEPAAMVVFRVRRDNVLATSS